MNRPVQSRRRVPCIPFLLLSIIVIAPPTAAVEPLPPARNGDVAEGVKKAEKPRLDPGKIYRCDPLLGKFEPIDAKALKPDHVYHRYSPSLNRWVWSKATADKKLAYAMGPGSVQPTALFDLTASKEERTRTLEAQAPDLARLSVVQGARAAVKLQPDGTWKIQGVSDVGQIYDLETGQRWEWHGDRRSGVTHLGGNSWRWHDGRLVPVGYGHVLPFDWCP
jgi:hypothetical protein